MATYPSIGSTNWTAPLKNYIDATSGVTRQKFADLTYPITTGHSGAGKLIFPDGTIDTNRIAEAMHLPIIDCGDFRLQQDGSFVNIHSSVLNTVTNVAGNPYALSASLAHQIILNPALYYNNPPIGEFFPLTTWEDVAREFGARVLLTPELKIDGTYPFTAGSSGTAFLAKLQATGMTDSVMVNSFSLAELTPLIAGGIPVMLNTSGDQSGGPAIATNTAAYAAGVRHLAIDIVVNTPAVVATYKSIGFKVWAYDVQNQYDSAAWLAAGTDVIMSDDPMYSSGVTASYRRTVDVFALGAFPSGMLPASGLAIDRGTLAYGRWTPRTNTSGGTGLGFLSPVASPAGTYTLGFTVCFDNLGSDLTRHADVAIAALDDRYWDFSTARSVNSGYTVVVRPDSLNQFGVFEVVAGVTTSKANTNNGPVTTSGALSSGVAITTIPVTSTASFINSGFKYLLPTGQQATVSTDTNAGATTLPVSSITPSALVPSGTTLTSVLRIVAPAGHHFYAGRERRDHHDPGVGGRVADRVGREVRAPVGGRDQQATVRGDLGQRRDRGDLHPGHLDHPRHRSSVRVESPARCRRHGAGDADNDRRDPHRHRVDHDSHVVRCPRRLHSRWPEQQRRRLGHGRVVLEDERHVNTVIARRR
jgi:glycerophosphoryl diester phosphodiesterase